MSVTCIRNRVEHLSEITLFAEALVQPYGLCPPSLQFLSVLRHPSHLDNNH